MGPFLKPFGASWGPFLDCLGPSGDKNGPDHPRQPEMGRRWVQTASRAVSWVALGANLGLSGGSGAHLGAILGPFGAILGPGAAIFEQRRLFLAEKADNQKTSKNHWFFCTV